MLDLVIVTGSSKIILTRWLPLIRSIGEYSGDVLVLDYGIIVYNRGIVRSNPEIVKKLKDMDNVTVLQPTTLMKNLFIDRIKVARDYLTESDRWKNYNKIMMIDGNDTVFYGSIQPLFEMSKDVICYVKEHPSNLLKIWDDFFIRKFIQDEFKGIENNPIINGGMVVGPAELFLKLLDSELELVKKYGSDPSDQLFLDLLIYYFNFPAKEVGYEWNYTHAVIGKIGDRPIGPRKAVFKDGKAYAVEDGRPIIIEHRTGTGWWFWQSAEGLALLSNDVPVKITEEFEHELDYKALHFDAYRGKDPEWFKKFIFPACR